MKAIYDMIDARSNSYIRMNQRKPFKVVVCAITLVAFFVNTFAYDLTWAGQSAPSELTSVGSEGAAGPGLSKELNVATFKLPDSLGMIRDSWSSKVPTPNSKLATIIHIQDAHCNYASQSKVAEIVEYLNKEYGIDTINLEGGAREYDLSPFTDIKDKALRAKASDYFVKEGLVNGAEYFAVNNPEKVTLWGMEDPKLYVENLSIYRNSLKNKEAIDKYLKSLSAALSGLKTKIYSKELFEFDLKYGQYKAANLEFNEYLSYLIRKAGEMSIDIKKFNDIYLLSKALDEEAAIDFEKADNERGSLIDALQKKLSKRVLEELVVKTVDFESDKISQKDYYSYLASKAQTANVELKEFPELERYIAYISMDAAINKPNVAVELESLENTIRAGLCRTDEERKLSELSKNLALLKNIFGISISRQDYEYYKKNKDSFGVRKYISFITDKAPSYGVPVTFDDNIRDLDKYREYMIGFYECSLKRDNAFLKNLHLNKSAVVITGGFHTENLAELFKKNGINYISILPNFRNEDGYVCNYYKLLSGEKSLDLRAQLPSVLNATIATPPPLNPTIMDAVNGHVSVEAEPLKPAAAVPSTTKPAAEKTDVEAMKIEAIRLEIEGASRERILKETGHWRLGMDMRLNIDFASMRLRPDAGKIILAKNSEGQKVVLGDIIEDGWDGLLLVPELARVPIGIEPASEGPIKSWGAMVYKSKNGETVIAFNEAFVIRKDGSLSSVVWSDLVHELTHVVANIKGYAPAGNPYMEAKRGQLGRDAKVALVLRGIMRSDSISADDAAKKLKAEWKEDISQGAIDCARSEETDEALTGRVKDAQISPKEERMRYRLLQDEAVARMQQFRLNMTPEQRDAESQYETLTRMLREDGLLKSDQLPEKVLIDLRGSAKPAAAAPTAAPVATPVVPFVIITPDPNLGKKAAIEYQKISILSNFWDFENGDPSIRGITIKELLKRIIMGDIFTEKAAALISWIGQMQPETAAQNIEGYFDKNVIEWEEAAMVYTQLNRSNQREKADIFIDVWKKRSYSSTYGLAFIMMLDYSAYLQKGGIADKARPVFDLRRDSAYLNSSYNLIIDIKDIIGSIQDELDDVEAGIVSPAMPAPAAVTVASSVISAKPIPGTPASSAIGEARGPGTAGPAYSKFTRIFDSGFWRFLNLVLLQSPTHEFGHVLFNQTRATWTNSGVFRGEVYGIRGRGFYGGVIGNMAIAALGIAIITVASLFYGSGLSSTGSMLMSAGIVYSALTATANIFSIFLEFGKGGDIEKAKSSGLPVIAGDKIQQIIDKLNPDSGYGENEAISDIMRVSDVGRIANQADIPVEQFVELIEFIAKQQETHEINIDKRIFIKSSGRPEPDEMRAAWRESTIKNALDKTAPLISGITLIGDLLISKKITVDQLKKVIELCGGDIKIACESLAKLSDVISRYGMDQLIELAALNISIMKKTVIMQSELFQRDNFSWLAMHAELLSEIGPQAIIALTKIIDSRSPGVFMGVNYCEVAISFIARHRDLIKKAGVGALVAAVDSVARARNKDTVNIMSSYGPHGQTRMLEKAADLLRIFEVIIQPTSINESAAKPALGEESGRLYGELFACITGDVEIKSANDYFGRLLSVLSALGIFTDPSAIVAELRRASDDVLNGPFDYNDNRAIYTAFIGVIAKGISGISYQEFVARIEDLKKFDKAHPGYWKNLFEKGKGLKIIQVGEKTSRMLDISKVDETVLDKNAKELLSVVNKINSLNWLSEDFPEGSSGSKTFNLRNLYFQMKKQMAEESGQLKAGERFSIAELKNITDEMIRMEIEANIELFYRVIFKIAMAQRTNKAIADKCLRLMRDLIICDIFTDEALRRDLASKDFGVRQTAFKQIYEDRKNHLPNAIDLRLDSLKGLSEEFGALSSSVYEELAKAKLVQTRGFQGYSLVPQGFLSVFRGRAGMSDCSFDKDDYKGHPYTRSMHEDTIYYFVYKGKELKGYVGLLVGKTEDGRRILTIDTVNSPSIDGQELLGNLFNALAILAQDLGCDGIALPDNMGPSFNFDNQDTIENMDVYKNARPIKVTPVHEQTWRDLVSMFGEDRYNSIKSGKFVLLNIPAPPPAAAPALDVSTFLEAAIDRGGEIVVWNPNIGASISSPTAQKYHANRPEDLITLRGWAETGQLYLKNGELHLMIGGMPAKSIRAPPVTASVPAPTIESMEESPRESRSDLYIHAEGLIRAFADDKYDTFNKNSGELRNLFKQMSTRERMSLFRNVLLNVYSLGTSKISGIKYLPDMDSKLDQSLLIFRFWSADIKEDIPYLIELLKDDAISDERKEVIWEVLGQLSNKYADAVVKDLVLNGFRPEWLIEKAMSGIGYKGIGYQISLILSNALDSKEVSFQTKKNYADMALNTISQYLKDKRGNFNDRLTQAALEVVEPDTKFEGPNWRAQVAGKRADVRKIYIEQVMAVNEIFQEAYSLISNNEKMTYEEFLSELIGSSIAAARFNVLTKNQKVLVRLGLINFFKHKFELEAEFKKACAEYPVEEFSKASTRLMELNNMYKDAKRKGEEEKEGVLSGEIVKHRGAMVDLRRKIYPYFKDRFGISEEDMPELAIVRLGSFSIEVEVDLNSLQKYFKPKASKSGDADADKKTEVSYKFDEMFKAMGMSMNKASLDMDKVDKVIRSFPEFLYGNYQDEMVAYMTNAELRFSNFDNLIDFYRKYYEESLVASLKSRKEIDFEKNEAQIRNMIQQMWRWKEWAKVKNKLKTVKKLIDNMVDAKATILLADMMEKGSGGDIIVLKKQAYNDAARYVMGIFQLVPILKTERLSTVFDSMKDEVARRGLTMLKVRIGNRQTVDYDKTKPLIGGFQRGDFQFSRVNDEGRIVDHETQHLIYKFYTGAEAGKHTNDMADFWTVLDNAVANMSSPAQASPAAALAPEALPPGMGGVGLNNKGPEGLLFGLLSNDQQIYSGIVETISRMDEKQQAALLDMASRWINEADRSILKANVEKAIAAAKQLTQTAATQPQAPPMSVATVSVQDASEKELTPETMSRLLQDEVEKYNSINPDKQFVLRAKETSVFGYMRQSILNIWRMIRRAKFGVIPALGEMVMLFAQAPIPSAYPMIGKDGNLHGVMVFARPRTLAPVYVTAFIAMVTSLVTSAWWAPIAFSLRHSPEVLAGMPVLKRLLVEALYFSSPQSLPVFGISLIGLLVVVSVFVYFRFFLDPKNAAMHEMLHAKQMFELYKTGVERNALKAATESMYGPELLLWETEVGKYNRLPKTPDVFNAIGQNVKGRAESLMPLAPMPATPTSPSEEINSTSEAAPKVLKNVFLEATRKGPVIAALKNAMDKGSPAAVKVVEELITEKKIRANDSTAMGETVSLIEAAALAGSKIALYELRDAFYDESLDAGTRVSYIRTIMNVGTPESKDVLRSILMDGSKAEGQDESFERMIDFLRKKASRMMYVLNMGYLYTPAEAIVGIIKNRDTPLLDALAQAYEVDESDLARGLIYLKGANYRTCSEAIVVLAHTAAIVKFANLNLNEFRNAYNEDHTNFAITGKIGAKQFLRNITARYMQYTTQALELMVGGMSADDRANLKLMADRDPSLMPKLINMAGVYFRIISKFPDTCAKIKESVKMLLTLKDEAALNNWLYTQAPWNAATYEKLIKSEYDPSGKLIKPGYDPSLWKEGFRKTVPSGMGGVDPVRRMKDQTWQLYEVAQANNVAGLPPRSEGFSIYEEAEDFAKKYLLENNKIRDEVIQQVKMILTETRKLRDVLKGGSEQAVVTVEINQNFLMDAYSGVGVAGCFNPISGVDREMPLMHSLETDSLFLRIYDEGGTMIANAILILTENGVVVQPLYESTSINIDLQGAVFDALAELVQKGMVPAVLMTRQSAGVVPAKEYLSDEKKVSSKSKILQDEYHFDFGTVDNFVTTNVLDKDKLKSYKPIVALTAVTKEEDARKKRNEDLAQAKMEAQKVLFGLGFKDINFGPLLKQLDDVVFDMDEAGVRGVVDSLKNKDGSVITDDQRQAISAAIIGVKARYSEKMQGISAFAPAPIGVAPNGLSSVSAAGGMLKDKRQAKDLLTLEDFPKRTPAHSAILNLEEVVSDIIKKGKENIVNGKEKSYGSSQIFKAEKDGYISIDWKTGKIALIPISEDNLRGVNFEHRGIFVEGQDVLGYRDKATYLKLPGTIVVVPHKEGTTYTINAQKLGADRNIYIDPEAIWFQGEMGEFEYGRTFIVMNGIPQSTVVSSRESDPSAITYGALLDARTALKKADAAKVSDAEKNKLDENIKTLEAQHSRNVLAQPAPLHALNTSPQTAPAAETSPSGEMPLVVKPGPSVGGVTLAADLQTAASLEYATAGDFKEISDKNSDIVQNIIVRVTKTGSMIIVHLRFRGEKIELPRKSTKGDIEKAITEKRIEIEKAVMENVREAEVVRVKGAAWLKKADDFERRMNERYPGLIEYVLPNPRFTEEVVRMEDPQDPSKMIDRTIKKFLEEPEDSTTYRVKYKFVSGVQEVPIDTADDVMDQNIANATQDIVTNLLILGAKRPAVLRLLKSEKALSMYERLKLKLGVKEPDVLGLLKANEELRMVAYLIFKARAEKDSKIMLEGLRYRIDPGSIENKNISEALEELRQDYPELYAVSPAAAKPETAQEAIRPAAAPIATGIAIDTIEARTSAVTEAFKDANGRSTDVRIVQGVPLGSMTSATTTANGVSRTLAKNEYGVRGNMQIFIFEIDPGNPDKTRNNMKTAVTSANNKLEAGGRVVIFAPNMDNGLNLTGEFEQGTSTTVLSDAYTDYDYPDMVARMALARNISYYYECYVKNDAINMAETLKVINTILEKIAQGNPQLGAIEDLFKFALRIKPVDYNKDIAFWKNAQLAAAVAV